MDESVRSQRVSRTILRLFARHFKLITPLTPKKLSEKGLSDPDESIRAPVPVDMDVGSGSTCDKGRFNDEASSLQHTFDCFPVGRL
ncbi:MAG: hypothetical protein MI923_02465 [Phycisphaerales bacterium]|nr:hypothetical protein [Phycisphaerales bacterium]